MSGLSAAEKNNPVWINEPYNGYPVQKYVAATGSGKDNNEADKNAAAELCRILNQNIETEENLQQTASSKSEGLSTYLSTVTTSSSVTDVSGLAIKDRWQGKDGTCYARAVLDRDDAGSHYSLLFNTNADEVDTLVNAAAGKSSTFEACALLLKAYRTAKENDGYSELLSVLNPAYHKIPSYGSSEAVGMLAQKAFNAVTVRVAVSGDVDSRIAAVFSSVINEAGIMTTTNPKEKAPYSLFCTVSFQNAGQNGAIYYIRYTVTCSLTETATGKDILNFSAGGRQGKLSTTEAEQSAVRTVETKVGDDFTQKFFSLFDAQSGNTSF